MKRYITLLHFTEQGAKNIKNSTKRAHNFDTLAEKAGVIIEGQFWTTGSLDGVLIIKTDDDKKALHLLVELAAGGNVRTETLRAFTAEEFDSIIIS
ncbi:MAG: GYD domain-containing protein [Chthoniobacter sp.]|nr:GYD domain-containing protein [Chthoniobacter sp.]